MTPQSQVEPLPTTPQGVRTAASANESTADSLAAGAAQLARNLAWVPGQQESSQLRERCELLFRNFQPLLTMAGAPAAKPISENVLTLDDQVYLLRGELEDACATFRSPQRLPQVCTSGGAVIPRIAALAGDFLASTAWQFSPALFASYIGAFQQVTVLRMAELWMLIPVMKLVLLEQIAGPTRRSIEHPAADQTVQHALRSLQEIKQTPWAEVIEPLILFDRILRDDPAGAYPRMDYETREAYRQSLVKIADRCDCAEIKVAGEALALAREALVHRHQDARVALRESHVGMYLIGEGKSTLQRRVGFHAPLGDRLRALLLRHPDDFYLPGIAALTFAIVSGIVLLLTPPSTSLWFVLLSILAVLIPGSQSAVQVMNYLITLLLPAQVLPKLDFSDGLPVDCVTMVAIPTMLLSPKQVRRLVEDLEVRYLGNRDPNLYFALLSDLPDSASQPREDDPLIHLASNLISRLNEKYSVQAKGSFFLFHRHRIYNPRERIWMGWERKRGKLMDLNKLLRGEFDSFPVKVGDLSVLASIRFVITLDSDTELPRGSAARLAGTLAHPLNQAIVDPEKGIVVAGYGILQPRVGVSVQSSARSRLAQIYSGQTGFDIYTHATSDVYQDLYGEGIFVGKGIYEVESLHRVLDRRFPRNALLSHDLVEGAYARAGLVSDIEIIEDYPSHYSAHNKRKHRWLRGDWQIAGWLLPMVPEESGRPVPNPLSVVSRWKIFDNLRRSLVEPAIFLLFLLGWLCLPGSPAAWTAATTLLLFLPAVCQLAVDLLHAAKAARKSVIQDALDSFLNAGIANILTITFLAHQALLSLDAVVRTMVRRLITRQRLLQWETAAEAELVGGKRTTLDIYLSWTPALVLAVFALLWLIRPTSLFSALPIFILWAFSKPVSLWLDRPPRAPRKTVSDRDRWLLRVAALRTWRYFSDFSTAAHHWLVPDNVQEKDGKVAARVSTTNLGLLLNARQAAATMGYLTVPEFARLTLLTLDTVSHLPRHRGHLLNWYDTQTLKPLTPAVISSVDNGNLIASLWTLQQGSLDLLTKPIFPRELADGLVDHLSPLASSLGARRRSQLAIEKSLRQPDWLRYVLSISDSAFDQLNSGLSPSVDLNWFRDQAAERIHQINQIAQTYTPWILPQFDELRNQVSIFAEGDPEKVSLQTIPEFIDSLIEQLSTHASSAPAHSNSSRNELLQLLTNARASVTTLIDDLRAIASQSASLADEMDFRFLFNPGRKLFTVAFELENDRNLPSCYDLLASEARIAYFVAIAKDDIPQESWFQLGRPPLQEQGITGLLSWSGTMFEYLMPTLWMRLYPNTLLECAAKVAVNSQRAYASEKGVPWGISESAHSQVDDSGNYSYFAFGDPNLAIHKPDRPGPVISPYSTFLALDVDSVAALRNLRHMHRKNWLGTYGFYESLDFSSRDRSSRSRGPEVVRCWMAHHQGMTLLAIVNFLNDNIVQNWFHCHPRVQATELLLQEKPLGRVA